MPIVVDTYNVLHVTGVLPAEMAGVDVEGLAGLIENSRYSRVQTWLICDGTGGGKRRKIWFNRNILIEYCGPGKDADSAIGSMIDVSTSPRRMLVVSSDGSVIRGARRRRCRVESAQKFLQQLSHDAGQHPRVSTRKKDETLDAEQVKRWIRTFGIGSELLSIASNRERIDEAKPMRDSPAVRRESADPVSVTPTRRGGRALEHVKRLRDVDPVELERFDMREWLP